MNLAMLRPGESGVIKKIGVSGALRRRLMDMGVLSGETVTMKKIAPLGDPLEITVKSYHLSLRKKEAEAIELEPA